MSPQAAASLGAAPEDVVGGLGAEFAGAVGGAAYASVAMPARLELLKHAAAAELADYVRDENDAYLAFFDFRATMC